MTEVLDAYLVSAQQTLSFSEHAVIREYLSFGSETQGHYQRLFLRSSPLQRRDKLGLPAETFDQLSFHRFIVPIPVHAKVAMSHMTRAELMTCYKEIGLKAKGKKIALIEGLEEYWHKRWAPAFDWIAHHKIFQRAVRWYTAHPSGSLEPLIIQELGHRSYLSKGRANTAPLFACRQTQRLFEHARRLSPYRTSQAPSKDTIQKFQADIKKSKATILGQKFSPETRLNRSLHHWIEHLYKTDLALALEYLSMIPPQLQHGPLVRKVALECQRQKKSTEGLALLDQIFHHQPLDERLALTQSYNQMAHKIRKPRRTLPKLKAPAEREITLLQSGQHKNRPVFRVKDADLFVEKAVCSLLNDQGHLAFFTEGTVWQALMILLFWDAITAPIPNQLPSPVLSAPLDFGRPEFTARREQWIEPIFKQIESGDAPRLLHANIKHLNVTARGLGSHRISASTLETIAEKIDGPALAKLMHILMVVCHQQSKGMPDLLVFPNTNLPFDISFPNRFRSPFLLAELKTRSDKLSPAQKVWFHRLSMAKIPAEIWQITHKPWRPQ